MDTITVSYSAHRPETVELTARLMREHQQIILEEPPHPDFTVLLRREITIEDHLLELDVGYPEFTIEQYRLLQELHSEGKSIHQLEPYLEHLLRIQLSFADGLAPEDIPPDTVESTVYTIERDATGSLISYYEAARGDDFEKLLSAMNSFAKADARRFVLRDKLRAAEILGILEPGRDIYIEAGTIHLLLFRLLAENLSDCFRLCFYSADREAVKQLGARGSLLGPGDLLTLHYIWGNDLTKARWQSYCARALIYSKIVIKDEIPYNAGELAHTRNELDSIAAVRTLSVEDCRKLYHRIRLLPTDEAAELVKVNV